MIWTQPTLFGFNQNNSYLSKTIWTVQNNFGPIEGQGISPEKSNLNLTKLVWTQPNRFGPDQKKLYPSKTIWTVQNNFEPIEGQGINP